MWKYELLNSLSYVCPHMIKIFLYSGLISSFSIFEIFSIGRKTNHVPKNLSISVTLCKSLCALFSINYRWSLLLLANIIPFPYRLLKVRTEIIIVQVHEIFELNTRLSRKRQVQQVLWQCSKTKKKRQQPKKNNDNYVLDTKA